MADPTPLDEKLAEALGLTMAEAAELGHVEGVRVSRLALAAGEAGG